MLFVSKEVEQEWLELMAVFNYQYQKRSEGVAAEAIETGVLTINAFDVAKRQLKYDEDVGAPRFTLEALRKMSYADWELSMTNLHSFMVHIGGVSWALQQKHNNFLLEDSECLKNPRKL